MESVKVYICGWLGSSCIADMKNTITLHVVGEDILRNLHVLEGVNHSNEQVLLLGVGKEFHVLLSAMVANHGEASSGVLTPCVSMRRRVPHEHIAEGSAAVDGNAYTDGITIRVNHRSQVAGRVLSVCHSLFGNPFGVCDGEHRQIGTEAMGISVFCHSFTCDKEVWWYSTLEVGAIARWTLSKKGDDAFNDYRREYKKRFARIKAGKLSADEYYTWSKAAREVKAVCEAGEITQDKFKEWLESM